MDLQVISGSQITRGRKLGEGGFGIVYAGTWNYHDVAIKTLRLSEMTDELKDEFNRESKIMARLNNPAVIRLYGITEGSDGYAMILEYMSGGDLYHLLSNKKKVLPWQPLRWRLATDIGSGLAYLHAQRILHRDLKSLNILLDKNMRAKITDFGLSKIKHQTGSLYTKHMAGSIPWMAPELSKRGVSLTPAADIYAYGMILWEITTRKIPFSDAPNPQIIPIWVSQGEREEIPDDCPKGFADVIRRCWVANPQKRPTASHILQLLTQARPQQTQTSSGVSSTSTQTLQNFPRQTVKRTSSWIRTQPQANLSAGVADYKTGLALFRKCEYIKSLPFLQKSAEASYPPAYLKLERIYSRAGAIIPKRDDLSTKWRQEVAQSIAWFKKEAGSGGSEAYVNLGYCYFIGIGVEKDNTQAFKYFSLAAEQQSPDAQRLVGQCYETGWGVKKDLVQAFKYYSLAAGQGDVNSQYEVGHAYLLGAGVDKNLKLAVKYLKVVADREHVLAQKFLGWCYRTGSGIEKNRPFAFKYYMLAAEKGDAFSQYNVGLCYETAAGVEKNIKLAIKYYTLAAEQGHAASKKNLKQLLQANPQQALTSSQDTSGLTLYLKGLTLFNRHQYRNALPHLQRAGEAGYPPAYLRLHSLYEASGLVGPKRLQIADLWKKKAVDQITWYQTEAKKGDAQAQFDLGYCYKNGIGVAEDKILTNKYYRLAAEQGHSSAQTSLGKSYYIGYGLKKNVQLAVHYFKVAANQLHAIAQCNLGWCYQNGHGVDKNLAEAVEFYKIAVDQGYSTAQFRLGSCYENGNGIKKDLIQAVKYYGLAADQGLDEGQLNLGLCYLNGDGVVKDLTKAATYFQLAAEQGYKDAQYLLGHCYENGLGVLQNYDEAIKYYRLAASKGNAFAQNALGFCYNYGKGVEINLEQALKYYGLAVEQKNTKAQYNLGKCFAEGLGVKKNPVKAFQYYQIAANQGDADAQFSLGSCFYYGKGVKKDYGDAVYYFKLAADQGNESAQLYMGSIYKNGRGVTKNPEQAAKYYRLAADQGDKMAKKALKRLGYS